jgi:colanic acid biosynthesis glycosyl transferase WcaI
VHASSFAISSAPLLLHHAFWKPDVVWIVVPSILIAPIALIVARLSGARVWLHVQDFEIDAAFETGLLELRVLRGLGLALERQLMRKFDRVSTISRPMIARLIDKGVIQERCVFFPNWVDLEAIRPLQGPNPFRRDLRIADEVGVALYSGSMSEKQGLETVLKAARRLRHNASLRFVLCGEGAARKRLLERYGDLPNLLWLPLQPAARLNDLLNLADIHLLPQLPGVADLVMPSKLTGMLASGRPVIATAVAGTEIHKVVSDCGIVVPPDDDKALGEAILKLLGDSAERLRMGKAARNYAIANIDSVRILLDFEHALLSCCQKLAG